MSDQGSDFEKPIALRCEVVKDAVVDRRAPTCEGPFWRSQFSAPKRRRVWLVANVFMLDDKLMFTMAGGSSDDLSWMPNPVEDDGWWGGPCNMPGRKWVTE